MSSSKPLDVAHQHRSSRAPGSNPFLQMHMGEIKGPAVAGHPGLADDGEGRLGLEVLVPPGGEKKISVQSRVTAVTTAAETLQAGDSKSRIRLGLRCVPPW